MSSRVLITGAATPAGRSLIDALGQETLTILACDHSPDVGPERHVSRSFWVHPSDHSEFIGELITLCANHDVDVVVPMRAEDQLALASATKLFAGLGSPVWLAPISECATGSQVRRIVRFAERGRARLSRSSVTTWLRRFSGIKQPAPNYA